MRLSEFASNEIISRVMAGCCSLVFSRVPELISLTILLVGLRVAHLAHPNLKIDQAVNARDRFIFLNL